MRNLLPRFSCFCSSVGLYYHHTVCHRHARIFDFLGWLAKTLILKFGGTSAYHAALPGFLGLALGDVTMIFFWVAVDGWPGRMGHYLMPN